MTITAGYDVGGAHLKVALVENDRLVAVRQIVCPLWQGLDRFDAALDEAAELTGAATLHAVTMTAELTEIFESRASGRRRDCAKIARTVRRRDSRLHGP